LNKNNKTITQTTSLNFSGNHFALGDVIKILPIFVKKIQIFGGVLNIRSIINYVKY